MFTVIINVIIVMEEPQDSETTTTDVKIQAEKVELKRTLGLIGASSIVIGSIIGSGIFVSPKGVLQNTGSVGLCLGVWALTGIVQLGSCFCFAELGTCILKSGGMYTYLRSGVGNFLAFAFVLQMMLIQSPGALVIILLTFAKYMVTMLPACGSPEFMEKLIAAAAIVTLVVANSYSAKLGAYVAIATTAAKLSALVVIIIGGIVVMIQGTTSELGTGFEGTSQDPTSLALAFYSATFAYGGAENLNIVVEEIKNPSRTLPRAIITSILVVIVVYVLTNVSYLAVMTRAELLNAEAVAVVWGDRVLGAAAKIIPIAVMISTFGAANNGVFSNTRIIYAAAKDKNIPDVLSFIQINQLTPLSAMTVTVTMAMILLVPGDVGTLINYLAFLYSFFSAAVFLSLIILRFRKMKDVHRPVKVPLVLPIVMVLFFTYMFLAPLVISPELEYVYVAAGVFGGAIVLYVPFIYFKLGLPYYDDIVTWFQLVLQVCPPTKFVDDVD